MTTELALAGLCLWLVGYAVGNVVGFMQAILCLLYTSPSPRDS